VTGGVVVAVVVAVEVATGITTGPITLTAHVLVKFCPSEDVTFTVELAIPAILYALVVDEVVAFKPSGPVQRYV
jgi:hypothetical protein